jgi:hypothetical protein
MNKKQAAAIILDMLICASAALCLFLLDRHLGAGTVKTAAISAVLLMVGALAAYELVCWHKKPMKKRKKLHPISTVILLGEKDEPLHVWDLTGKAGLVIGKGEGDSSVDIDLSDTAFQTYIDPEHALLNYNGSGWWLEDVSARNGVSVTRQGRELLLGRHAPVELLPGDVINIAEFTRLAAN